MINTLRVNAKHGCDFRSLADHMTKFRNLNLHKSEILAFSTFPFSLQLMFDQTLSNVITCLKISHQKNYIQMLPKRASKLQWILCLIFR